MKVSTLTALTLIAIAAPTAAFATDCGQTDKAQWMSEDAAKAKKATTTKAKPAKKSAKTPEKKAAASASGSLVSIEACKQYDYDVNVLFCCFAF